MWVIIEVVNEYDFVEKLGVYVGDNAESNDTAWKESLKILNPNRDSKTSRSRCLGHIINLATKAFIFGRMSKLLRRWWTQSMIRLLLTFQQ